MSLSDAPIPNDEFREVMNEIINVWFKRWRDNAASLTQTDWDVCITELTDIGHRHNYKFVHELGAVLVSELERRTS